MSETGISMERQNVEWTSLSTAVIRAKKTESTEAEQLLLSTNPNYIKCTAPELQDAGTTSPKK
jgi:hypothetical protein